MSVRTNRLKGHGALTYQQHKEYWRNKAKEWLKNPVRSCGDILYFGGLYGLRTEFKEMGIFEIHYKLLKEEMNYGKRNCSTGKSD